MRTALALTLLLPSVAGADVGTRRFAVLAGSNDGGGGRVELRYAHTDAEALAGLLQGMGGVSVEDTRMLLGVDRDGIDAALSEVRGEIEATRAAGRRAELVFYYSGHSDEDGLLPEGTRYAYDELKADLKAVPADVSLVILDSCASGALVRTKGGTMRAPFLVDDSVDLRGHAYLTSSSEDEVAQESDAVGGSYFTHYLVSGMRGAADVSADGQVTLHELYQFAKDETLHRTERSLAGPQHPSWHIELAGTGDMVVTSLAETTSSLHVLDTLEGRLFLRTDNGKLVAELSKQAGRDLVLGLEPGGYTALWARDEDLSEAHFTLGPAETVELGALDFGRVQGELAVARGGDGLRHVWASAGVFPPIDTGGPPEGRIDHAAFGVLLTRAEHLDGIQYSFGANSVADSAKGAQLAIGANLAGGEVKGVQAAVGGNLARRVDGFQGSAGINVATDGVRGVQGTAGMNLANEVDGAQLAPINAAKHVKGAQIGIVNVADEVDGVQIGLINVAVDADESIALIPINLAGYNHIQLFTSEINPLELGLTWGGKRFFVASQIGGRWENEEPRWTALIGLGLHVPVAEEKVYVDFDITGGSYFRSSAPSEAVLTRGRAMVGIAPHKRIAFFAGPSLTYLKRTKPDPLGFQRTGLGQTPGLATDALWVGLFGGVRF